MPRLKLSFFALMLAACVCGQPVLAQNVSVHSPVIPVVTDREYNILSEIRIVCADDTSVLNEVTLNVEGLPAGL